MRKYIYLIEKIKDGSSYKKGDRIWASHRCTGWRVVRKEKYSY